MRIFCPPCGGPTKFGDLRSGMFSFGDFFIECDDEKRTWLDAPKMKTGIQRDNRVVSFACEKCGYICSFLERYVREIVAEDANANSR
jgi:hypothetical protein